LDFAQRRSSTSPNFPICGDAANDRFTNSEGVKNLSKLRTDLARVCEYGTFCSFYGHAFLLVKNDRFWQKPSIGFSNLDHPLVFFLIFFSTCVSIYE